MSNKKTTRSAKKIVEPAFKIPAIAWVIGIVVIIAAVSVKKNFDLAQPPAPAKNTNNGQWQKITDKKALFYTKIFLARDRTFVSIPIKYEDNKTQTTWLTLQSSASAGVNTYLIAHPVLETLNWSNVSDGPFHLYQREATYKSFSDFLSNPPSESELMVDQVTQAQPQFKSLKHKVLTDNFDPTQVKFVLTTYIKPRIAEGITYYENILNATSGKVNKNDNLTWELIVPTAASASPYYLGNIHIDYQK